MSIAINRYLKVHIGLYFWNTNRSLTSLGKNQVIVLSNPSIGQRHHIAQQLCDAIGGEIVVVDKPQSFKHLFIGSNKPSGESKTIPYHLINHYEPNMTPIITKVHVKLIADTVDSILQRHKTPIILEGNRIWRKHLMCGFPDDDGIMRPLLPHVDFRHFYLNRDRNSLYRRIDSHVERLITGGHIQEVADLLIEGVLQPGSEVGSLNMYKQTIRYLLRNNFVKNDWKTFENYVLTLSHDMRITAKDLDTSLGNTPSALYVRCGGGNNNLYRKRMTQSTSKQTKVNDIVQEIIHWSTSLTREEFYYKVQRQMKEGKQISDMYNTRFDRSKGIPESFYQTVRDIYSDRLSFGDVSIPRDELEHPQWTADEIDVRAKPDQYVMQTYHTVWEDGRKLMQCVDVCDNIREKIQEYAPQVFTASHNLVYYRNIHHKEL